MAEERERLASSPCWTKSKPFSEFWCKSWLFDDSTINIQWIKVNCYFLSLSVCDMFYHLWNEIILLFSNHHQLQIQKLYIKYILVSSIITLVWISTELLKVLIETTDGLDNINQPIAVFNAVVVVLPDPFRGMGRSGTPGRPNSRALP